MNDERKLAYQDGIRAAVKAIEDLSHKAIMSPDVGGYKVLHNAANTLREMLERNVEPGPVDYERRLDIVAEVFEAVVDNATEGGSFRYLIYDRLGFDLDAYMPLYLAGGMTITNEFVIMEASPQDAEIAERLTKSLWPGPDNAMVKIEGGKEPWLTICQASETILGLSAALAAERERSDRRVAEAKTGAGPKDAP